MPVIAKGIGKNQFKRHFELFIDTIFYSLVSNVKILIRLGTLMCLKALFLYYIFEEGANLVSTGMEQFNECHMGVIPIFLSNTAYALTLKVTSRLVANWVIC